MKGMINIIEKLFELPPIVQGLAGTLFTYFVTALGASLVFFIKKVNQKVLDLLMGFAAGVMIAASFWSLLAPGIALAEELGHIAWLTAVIGFGFGGLFIIGSDYFLSKIKFKEENKSLKRSILLTTAVTMHNIPEGLAVGVAFGYAVIAPSNETRLAALMLALGIGLQNFPEGVCVSMPLRRDGYSRTKSFFLGQFSGMVEPIAGVIGVLATIAMREILPYALTFSAGAMIAVVAMELIPESLKENRILATLGLLLGFVIMMSLDVALG